MKARGWTLLGATVGAVAGGLLARSLDRAVPLARPTISLTAPYIDIHHADHVISSYRTMANGSFYLLLDTFGGNVTAIIMALKALYPRRGDIVAVVPRVAFSGGTLLALCSREIVAGPDAYFSPVDPQFGKCAARELSESQVASQYTALMSEWVSRLLSDQIGTGPEADNLRSLLMGEQVPHAWPLSAHELKAAGLNIRIDRRLS